MNLATIMKRDFGHGLYLFIGVILCCMSLAAFSASDRDSDGVEDGLDCAPDDARIAVQHTYFWDFDGDQSGDSNNPLTVCLVTPFNGSVPLGGDPDDNDNSRIAGFKPRGSRLLGVDFFALPDNGAWRSDLAREIGADTISMRLSWAGIESRPGVFDGPDAQRIRQFRNLYGEHSFSILLTVSPFEGDKWAVPEDLAPLLQNGLVTLNDPALVARFSNVLNFVRNTLGDTVVVSLQLGHEIDLQLPGHMDSQFWSSYANFFQSAKAHAKDLWGENLPVGITGTAKGLVREPAASLLSALNSIGDIVGVSYFPYDDNGFAIEPKNVKFEVAQIIARYYPKNIGFSQIGYPSSPAAGSSETRQAQFIGAFFQIWDEYSELIPFVSFASLHDPNLSGAYVGSIGLRTRAGAGKAKAAYHTLRSQTLNRGWWRGEMPEARPFLVGFTAAPYDHNPGGEIIDDAIRYTAEKIGSNGDFYALHFDSGVPWKEAAIDDFSTVEPPYSQNLIETWRKQRNAQPLGTVTAVAVNPLGIPRDHLAPYWGVGEGFYHDEQFNPVPTGVIQDYQDRLLPPPWAEYRLNSPEVKKAYLNYLRRVIDFFHPRYLISGVEVNLALQTDPQAFADYLDLQKHVYTTLKSDPAYRDVRIMVSMVAEYFVDDEFGVPQLTDTVIRPELKGMHLDGLRSLEPYTDVIGLSIYPIKTRLGTYEISGGFYDLLMDSIRAVTNKPVAITETGYPTDTFYVKNRYFAGSQEKQRLASQLMFYEAAKYNFEFVTNFSVRDQTAYMDKLRERARETPPFISPELVDFFEYFESIGIYSPDGSPKLAQGLYSTVLAISPANPAQRIPSLNFESPDNNLNVTLGVSNQGRLLYSIKRNGAFVLESSPLGLKIDGYDLGVGVIDLKLRSEREIHETYKKWGAHSAVNDFGTEYVIDIVRSVGGDRVTSMVWRVYNGGVAFRYVIPGSGPRLITGESTGWSIPYGSGVWYQLSTNNYESPYLRQEIGFFNTDIGGPLTVELASGAGYLTLTEGALRNYSGITFGSALGSNLLYAQFLDDQSWILPGGEATPWRLAVISPDLNGLVNSDLVTHVNEPPDPSLFPMGIDTGWIRPGRAVWSWWSDNDSGAIWDTQKQYVDYATRLRAEYVTIDIWWEEGFPTAEKDKYLRLSDLSAYAHTEERDVGLWVWRHWSRLVDEAERREFFRQVRNSGAVGVKVDYMSEARTESFENIALFEALVRDAADAKLMINFHGIHKPTGLERTWPNLVGHEGLAGMEYTSLLWKSGQFLPITHDAVVPFVRLVAGPADFTPVTFDPRKIGDTTFAHQLATAGIINSTVQHFADDPAMLLAQPAQEILRTLPTTWDETIVLPYSRLGVFVAEARRKGDRWYLFVINADPTNPVEIPDFNLSFLGDRTFKVICFKDQTRTSFARSELTGINKDSKIDVSTLAGGGFTALFIPEAIKERRVLQGFSSIPPNTEMSGWQAGYSRLRDHADLVSHSLQEGVPWPEAYFSSDPNTYSQHLNRWWSLLRSADEAVIPGSPRYIMVNPIETISYGKLAPYLGEQDYMPLPAPWDSLTFNDPAVKQAYLNYLVAIVEYFQPKYLATSIESNILLAKQPSQWLAFKELNQFIYTELKRRYPSLKVFTTIHYEHMLGLAEESRALVLQLKDSYPAVIESEVRDLLRFSDYFAISSYPFMMQNNRYISESGKLDFDYYDKAFAIAREMGKPVVFEQTGYISQDLQVSDRDVVLPGSEQRQAHFVESILGVAHTEPDVEFVINFTSGDYGLSYGSFPSTLTWAYIGLFREDGTPKPALEIWDQYRNDQVEAQRDFSRLRQGIVDSVIYGGLPQTWDLNTNPQPELYLRWQQAASLLPYFNADPSKPTGQYVFSAADTAFAQRNLALRDSLMPYLLPLFVNFQETGIQPARLFSSSGEQPLISIGDWLLAAPVTSAGTSVSTIQLPSGYEWLDWNTHSVYQGGSSISVEAPLSRLPVFFKSAVPPSDVPREMKGQRILGIEVKPSENEIWDAVQVASDFLGIQSVQIMFDWDQIEVSPGVYSAEILDQINQYFSKKGVVVSLTLRPIDAAHKNVPEDLRTVAFDSPNMIFRFQKLLDFVYAHLNDVTIASLGIGNEVDEWFRLYPDTFESYKSFYNYSLSYSKLVRPDIPIGVSGNLHAMLAGSRAELMHRLNEWSDVLLILYYPSRFPFEPDQISTDIAQLLTSYPNKPVHFREAGYSSKAVANGELVQAEFIRQMFSVWDRYSERIQLISFFHFTDFSPTQVDYWMTYYEGNNPTKTFRNFLEGLGLRKWFGIGEFKPSIYQFMIESRARGW